MSRAETTTGAGINLAQLDTELGGHGLAMNAENDGAKVVAIADGSPVTQAELDAAVAAHTAQPEPVPTLDEKLASVGVSVAEIRSALGL